MQASAVDFLQKFTIIIFNTGIIIRDFNLIWELALHVHVLHRHAWSYNLFHIHVIIIIICSSL